jgi:hypothetical protein
MHGFAAQHVLDDKILDAQQGRRVGRRARLPGRIAHTIRHAEGPSGFQQANWC